MWAPAPGTAPQSCVSGSAQAGSRRSTLTATSPRPPWERLAEAGQQPRILTGDATGPLPGEWDRIVSMVSVRPIPVSWLAALPVGGRLATTITNTTLLITAHKTDDGGAVGQVERDRAMFMTTRSGADYPPRLAAVRNVARTAEGDHVAVGRFPVLNVVEAWEVRTMLELAAPDIEHHYTSDGEARTAVMVHADGSWARASSSGRAPAVVHQGGPRRLWDLLDEVRDYWLQHGELPLHAARVRITLPDGVISCGAASGRRPSVPREPGRVAARHL